MEDIMSTEYFSKIYIENSSFQIAAVGTPTPGGSISDYKYGDKDKERDDKQHDLDQELNGVDMPESGDSDKAGGEDPEFDSINGKKTKKDV